MPLCSGIAQSITITAGFSSSASLTACLPSPASPTTEISESSSSMRRNPRRTNAWSSARRTVILRGGMCLHPCSGNAQAHQRSSTTQSGLDDLQRSTENFGALSHSHESDSPLSVLPRKPFSAVLHIQLQSIGREFQPHPGFTRTRMALDIVQGLLQDSKNMNS